MRVRGHARNALLAVHSMMSNPRTLLLMALSMLGLLLWMQWQEDYGPQRDGTDTQTPLAVKGEAVLSADVPTTADIGSAAMPTAQAGPGEAPAPAQTGPQGERVVVTTDVLRVEIDTRGGSVVVTELLDYPLTQEEPEEKVRLLDDTPGNWFAAQSGLVSVNGNAPDHNAMFSAARLEYSLEPGEQVLEVPLVWQDDSGLTVTKVLTFSRGSYVIAQQQEISNQSTQEWTGNAYRQLQRRPFAVSSKGIRGYANTERYSFVGAAWYSPQDKFNKIKYDKFNKDPLQGSFAGGWGAFLQHYFFAAWIPPAEEVDTYSTAVVPDADGERYLVRAVAPGMRVAPGETASSSARLYVGPKLQSTLDQIAPGLSLTVNYGVFTVLSKPLHWLLANLHKITNNWGFAIILLVLLIKAAFFKLSETQFRSMARMRKLQPRIAALKERLGDDRQKMNQAMLELYQKEKVNPLAGCLPMLVQIPVFFALYWVLLESVELRQAPFIGWIQNLTAPDPFFILPVLNGAAMVATQMLTPMAGMDPTQAKIMRIMPVAFSFMFAFFPAGLVLYWTTNASLSLLQQWIITRRIDAGAKS